MRKQRCEFIEGECVKSGYARFKRDLLQKFVSEEICFQECRHQILASLAQKVMRKNVFYCTVHTTGEKVEIADEVSVRELAK